MRDLQYTLLLLIKERHNVDLKILFTIHFATINTVIHFTQYL